jgi:hypothetical protein
LVKWRKYIVENYVKNFELKVSGNPYDQGFIIDFSFNIEEQEYLESLFNLNKFLKSNTPLIDMMDKNQIKLVSHLINFRAIKVDVNQVKQQQTLFTCIVDYYLSLQLSELSRNYFDFQNEIQHLFKNGYYVKNSDIKFMSQFKAHKDSRQLQYIMFASFILKLGEAFKIGIIMTNIRLITCLTSIKTGKHIGFFKNPERQIIEFTRNSSAHQNEVINYITKENKKEFENVKLKLLEMRRNVSEVIEDLELRTILDELILKKD